MMTIKTNLTLNVTIAYLLCILSISATPIPHIDTASLPGDPSNGFVNPSAPYSRYITTPSGIATRDIAQSRGSLHYLGGRAGTFSELSIRNPTDKEENSPLAPPTPARPVSFNLKPGQDDPLPNTSSSSQLNNELQSLESSIVASHKAIEGYMENSFDALSRILTLRQGYAVSTIARNRLAKDESKLINLAQKVKSASESSSGEVKKIYGPTVVHIALELLVSHQASNANAETHLPPLPKGQSKRIKDSRVVITKNLTLLEKESIKQGSLIKERVQVGIKLLSPKAEDGKYKGIYESVIGRERQWAKSLRQCDLAPQGEAATGLYLKFLDIFDKQLRSGDTGEGGNGNAAAGSSTSSTTTSKRKSGHGGDGEDSDEHKRLKTTKG